MEKKLRGPMEKLEERLHDALISASRIEDDIDEAIAALADYQVNSFNPGSRIVTFLRDVARLPRDPSGAATRLDELRLEAECILESLKPAKTPKTEWVGTDGQK